MWKDCKFDFVLKRIMRKEYSLKPFYKISYILNAVLSIFIVFLKTQNRLFPWASQWMWNIVAVTFAFGAIFFIYNAFFEKLIISESGIEYRTFLRHLFLSWEQVESIPAHFAFKILVAKSSKETKKSNISLYLFADNPIEGEIGQQIKQYAPHLFEQENKKSA
jgi:hypothetical protein